MHSARAHLANKLNAKKQRFSDRLGSPGRFAGKITAMKGWREPQVEAALLEGSDKLRSPRWTQRDWAQERPKIK